MIKIELNDRLKLIKHQIKIFKLRMTMVYLIELLEDKFTCSRSEETKVSKLKYQLNTL